MRVSEPATRNRVTWARRLSTGEAGVGTRAVRHWGRRSRQPGAHLIHLPASLGSAGITRLPRYYGRSDSCPAGSSYRSVPQGNPARERPPDLRTGLSASWVRPSDHSASNHLIAPPIAPARYPSASTASSKSRSGLRHKRAGSPDNPAESSSLTLRTGRSPPVASHPSSRRRSYFQLQDGERIPEEDSHLSDQTHSQTHPRVPSAPRRASRLGHPVS